MKTEKRAIGDIGEDLAVRYLVGLNHHIVSRNYLRKWGEIDIISEFMGILHFIEVKSRLVGCVSRETPHISADDIVISVSRETDGIETYMPEDNVHFWKKKRFLRAIRSYVAENRYYGDFEVDIIAVLLDFGVKRATLRILDNVLLE